MRVSLLLFCFLLLLPAFPLNAAETPPSFPAFERVETQRIRIVNSVDGAIQVSDDAGKAWHLIGRVTAPATESLMGYSAAGYAKPATVAATAVHGLRIRVGDAGTPDPLLINILPREFAQTPKLFGGHVSGLSGIYTTIPVGTSIFRGLSPLVGSPVYLEHDMGSDLEPLPLGYLPKDGDVLEIVVLTPTNPLKEVYFDNHAGGDVRVTYADGATRVLTHVVKPVVGIGRYDGCSYTGVGAINTNHDGVLTISTAPASTSPLFEGIGPERRGGFQIQPAFHNAQGDGAGAPSVLVIGSRKRPETPEMEGRPPLFYGYFDLAWSLSEPIHSWRMEVQRHHGGWEPMPTLIGSRPLALADVTALRLVRGAPGEKLWRDGQIRAAESDYFQTALANTRAGKSLAERGAISFTVAAPDRRTAFVSFRRDGQFAGVTNSVPYTFRWDTRTVPDGEYVIEAEAQDANNQTLSTTRTKIWVDNQHRVNR